MRSPGDALRQHDVFTAAAVDPDIFRSDLKVPAGEVWEITRHGFRLQTDEAGIIRSFIDVGGDRHLQQEWVAPANPFFYVDTVTIWMGEGDILGIEATGADASDVLHLYYNGFRHLATPEMEARLARIPTDR